VPFLLVQSVYELGSRCHRKKIDLKGNSPCTDIIIFFRSLSNFVLVKIF
jgi:hypothetical protein